MKRPFSPWRSLTSEFLRSCGLRMLRTLLIAVLVTEMCPCLTGRVAGYARSSVLVSEAVLGALSETRGWTRLPRYGTNTRCQWIGFILLGRPRNGSLQRFRRELCWSSGHQDLSIKGVDLIASWTFFPNGPSARAFESQPGFIVQTHEAHVPPTVEYTLPYHPFPNHQNVPLFYIFRRVMVIQQVKHKFARGCAVTEKRLQELIQSRWCSFSPYCLLQLLVRILLSSLLNLFWLLRTTRQTGYSQSEARTLA